MSCTGVFWDGVGGNRFHYLNRAQTEYSSSDSANSASRAQAKFFSSSRAQACDKSKLAKLKQGVLTQGQLVYTLNIGKKLATSVLPAYHPKMTSQFRVFLEFFIKPSFT
jgi:hypothetical protein